MKNVAIVVLNLCFLMRFSIVIATFCGVCAIGSEGVCAMETKP